MSPGDQRKTSVYPFVPTLESPSISQKETPKKTVNMESTEVFTEQKTELTEEAKNYQKYLKKINQYYQFTLPQYVKYQYRKIMEPWKNMKTNAYQVIPALRDF
ncbi:alpha-S2-casein-like [Rhinopithecus roxellana]|uniref:alpha-S2-casein-like n=1 Tax=Rhinopithecus roxellana TaxID=61622 RepID=UPI0012377285|nr:alpha-S2-casein-like [Rhinopithecus roxellana]